MTLHTEVEYADARYHGLNRASTGRLLALLKAHHDYAVRAPKDHVKPEIPVEAVSVIPRKPLSLVVSEIVSEPTSLTIDKIQRAVCKHFNITRNDLISARRHNSVCRPRQVGMYLAKILTLKSYPYIGHRFGGRDHTTAIFAVRKIESKIQTDANIANDVAMLTEMLSPAMEAAE